MIGAGVLSLPYAMAYLGWYVGTQLSLTKALHLNCFELYMSKNFWKFNVLFSLRGPGTMVLVLSWCMTLNTMWQMIQLHECVPGTRFD